MKAISKIILDAFLNGNKLLIIGNGGSASQSTHMAGELVGRFKLERRALPAIALTTDTSIITSIGNDIGFNNIFSRQVEALGNNGDVLFCLSTSGKSKNVLNAIKVAQEKGMIIYDVPRIGKDTPTIQERQLKLIHKICEEVEKGIYETIN